MTDPESAQPATNAALGIRAAVRIWRFLASGWDVIYRATGAAAADRALARRRARRWAQDLADVAGLLESAGLSAPAARCRATVALLTAPLDQDRL
jgi:hypothetical protein